MRRNAAFWAFPQRSRFGLPIRAALRAGRWRYRKIAPLEGRSGVSNAEQFSGRSAFCANFLQGLPRKNPNRKRLRALTRFSKERAFVPPEESQLRSPRIRPPFPEREGAKFRKRDSRSPGSERSGPRSAGRRARPGSWTIFSTKQGTFHSRPPAVRELNTSGLSCFVRAIFRCPHCARRCLKRQENSGLNQRPRLSAMRLGVNLVRFPVTKIPRANAEIEALDSHLKTVVRVHWFRSTARNQAN